MQLYKAGLLVVALSLMVACSEDPEQLAFQRERVDKALNDETRRAGQQFAHEYARQDGVVRLDSGVLYKVLRQGNGAKPDYQDTLKVHYEGKRVDGGVFDSSYQRQKPAELALKRTIKGWQQVLRLMPVGSRWEVVIPADLAYGATSPTPQIPPNSTLVFTIELLDIIPAGE